MSDNSPLRWPPRKNTSRADQFKLQHQELTHNYNVEGQTKIFFWMAPSMTRMRPNAAS